MLYSICQQIWKTQQCPQDWKMSVFIPIPQKRQCQRMLKLLHNCTHLTASKVMLKILQARLQQYVNREPPDLHAGFRKVEEAEIKLPTSLDHWKSKRVPEKYLLLLYWLCQSLWLCGSQQFGKFLKRWGYQTTWPASWEICMQVKKQQLEPDMEQQTDSKSGKEYIKAVYCHPAYLTYMQSTSCEMPVWMKHKLESRLLGEISITSDM